MKDINLAAPGALAAAVARVINPPVTPGQMSARNAAAVLQSCGGLPIMPYDAKAHRRTRSHVKPSSRERRARKIAQGKLTVVDGQLVGA